MNLKQAWSKLKCDIFSLSFKMSDVSDKIKGTLSRIKRVSQVLCCEFETLNPKKGGGVELKSTPDLENFVFLCSRSPRNEIKIIEVKI